MQQLSSSTKHAIETSFDQGDSFAIGISRYHHFTLTAKGMYSFKLTLEYEYSDCQFVCECDRCIYAAPASNNLSFVTFETGVHNTCDYSCNNEDADYGGSLETLEVDVKNNVDECLVSVHVDAGSLDSTDCNIDASDENYTLSAAGGALIAGICCTIPACWFWWKGIGKQKYEKHKLQKIKKKFLKQWKLFHVNGYNMLMKIFREKGVVDLIQSYMDELAIHTSEMKDNRLFASYYFRKYNFKQAFDIGLERPLLVNN